jgi:hypothetical protein
MQEDHTSGSKGRPWRRGLWGGLVGLLGALFIWIATPYNNFIVRSVYISDSYLPVAALFCILALVAGINPLLRWFRPRWALDSSQLAVALSVMLVASVLPGHGLMRWLPYTLGRTPLMVRDDKNLAEIYEEMDLPPSLFPVKLGYGLDMPASEYFVSELPRGESIPWEAWVGPLCAWGSLLFFCFMMMVGMALIAFPQWRRNERLAFPLLTVQQALIETPEEGRLFPPLFRHRSFWVAALAVLTLHLLAGAHVYFPEGIPAFPLNWSLKPLFTEGALAYVPTHIHTNRVYFIFLGVAFFMSTRTSFSIWFFTICYGVYEVVGRAYVPPYYSKTVTEHRVGAILATFLVIVWLGRAHWLHVGRCVAGKVRDAADQRDRLAGWMFLLGCAGVFLWLWRFLGAPPLWALLFVGFGVACTVVIARIVAESGMPFARLHMDYHLGLIKLAPVSCLSFVTVFASALVVMIFAVGSRVSPAVMAMHGFGMDSKASPQGQSRLAILFLVTLLAGFVVCGAAHLTASYHYSSTLDGKEQPVSDWGTRRLEVAHKDMLRLETGRVNLPVYSLGGHTLFGFSLAGVLQWACLAMPRWPLHPIGLLLVNSFFAKEAFASIFLGWFLKVLILRYGGARIYRGAQPFFLGLIIGEVVAAIVWSIVPGVLGGLLGLPYEELKVQPF